MAQMSLVLQDVFTSLKTGCWAGCPAPWSVKVSAGLQYPSGHFCAIVTPLSLGSLFPLLLPAHSTSYPKWDSRVDSAANPQASLKCATKQGLSIGFEWLFLFIVIQMVEILLHYTDRALKKCPDQGKIQVMEQHFQVWYSRGLL